jgi:hypothetical protein
MSDAEKKRAEFKRKVCFLFALGMLPTFYAHYMDIITLIHPVLSIPCFIGFTSLYVIHTLRIGGM